MREPLDFEFSGAWAANSLADPLMGPDQLESPLTAAAGWGHLEATSECSGIRTSDCHLQPQPNHKPLPNPSIGV